MAGYIQSNYFRGKIRPRIHRRSGMCSCPLAAPMTQGTLLRFDTVNFDIHLHLHRNFLRLYYTQRGMHSHMRMRTLRLRSLQHMNRNIRRLPTVRRVLMG